MLKICFLHELCKNSCTLNQNLSKILVSCINFCFLPKHFHGKLAFFFVVRECSEEELTATRELLSKYTDQLQYVKNENKMLLKKQKSHNPDGLVKSNSWVPYLPIIYIITPTNIRAEQKADLTRMSHTLKLVNNIHWIVVEDSENKSSMVSRLLERSGLNYTHLNVLTPPQFKMASKDPNWLKPRGVLQRNAGLDWLRNQKRFLAEQGVLYFADDDNTYSLDIFQEVRQLFVMLRAYTVQFVTIFF